MIGIRCWEQDVPGNRREDKCNEDNPTEEDVCFPEFIDQVSEARSRFLLRRGGSTGPILVDRQTYERQSRDTIGKQQFSAPQKVKKGKYLD
jgi:hypothetical protein